MKNTSVEEQMANALQQPEVGAGVEEAKRVAAQQRAERQRQIQALNLQRENILSQRTSSPNRRSALEAALAQIEAKIEEVN